MSGECGSGGLDIVALDILGVRIWGVVGGRSGLMGWVVGGGSGIKSVTGGSPLGGEDFVLLTSSRSSGWVGLGSSWF